MRFPGAVGLFVSTFLLACGPGPTTPPPSWRISVAKAGDGSGTITSTPGLINCGRSCSAVVAQGLVVTLTAKPDPGSTFEGWVDGCSGTGPCTPPVNVDVQVNALFRAQFSSITVTLEGDGEGRVVSEPAGIDCGSTCSASFKLAAPVKFRPTAAAGCYFAGWSGGPCVPDSSGSGSCNAKPEDLTGPVVATFMRLPPPPLPVLRVAKEGNGTGVVRSHPVGIDCGNDCFEGFDAGTVIELTAVPATGSVFERWPDGGTDPSLVITTGETDSTISARFSLTRHLLTVAPAGAGSGTITGSGIQCGSDCSEEVDYGSSVRLYAVADAGSWFTEWSQPSCGRAIPCFVTVTATRTVTATFVPVSRVGNATPFSQPFNLPRDQATAQQIVVTSVGTVHGLGLIAMGTGPVWARLGLYADSANLPGALLAETGITTFDTGGSERALSTGPLALSAGTYWIAANVSAPTTVGANFNLPSSLTTGRLWPYSLGFPNPFAGSVAGAGQGLNFYLLME